MKTLMMVLSFQCFICTSCAPSTGHMMHCRCTAGHYSIDNAMLFFDKHRITYQSTWEILWNHHEIGTKQKPKKYQLFPSHLCECVVAFFSCQMSISKCLKRFFSTFCVINFYKKSLCVWLLSRTVHFHEQHAKHIFTEKLWL